jgi:hypothetical protein
MMVRNRGSSMKNGSKLGHSKYQESGQERTLENGKQSWRTAKSHLKNMARCEISHKEGGTKAPAAIHGP